jgi:aspartyl-tRNA(Asn)/glutamyl-tRNA(Gln) amidotransferase subunit A
MSVVIPGIADAAKLIAAKKLSPVELTLAAMDGVLDAFILLTPEWAMADAKAAVG